MSLPVSLEFYITALSTNESINYTVRTVVRLFVRFRRIEWRTTNLFLSVNKNPNSLVKPEQVSTTPWNTSEDSTDRTGGSGGRCEEGGMEGVGERWREGRKVNESETEGPEGGRERV